MPQPTLDGVLFPSCAVLPTEWQTAMPWHFQSGGSALATACLGFPLWQPFAFFSASICLVVTLLVWVQGTQKQERRGGHFRGMVFRRIYSSASGLLVFFRASQDPRRYIRYPFFMSCHVLYRCWYQDLLIAPYSFGNWKLRLNNIEMRRPRRRAC
jgi:hypothetical protein